MARAPHGLGGVLVPALTLIGVLGIGAATVITIPRPERPGDDAAAARPLSAKAKRQLDAAATDSLLRRVHLTPDTLAAAGLSVQDADTVIMAMFVHVEGGDVADQLRAATRAYNQAVQAAGKAKPAPGQEPVSPAVRAQNLVNARAQLDSLLDNAWTLATATLSNEQKARLTTIRANAKWDGLPIQYLVTERADADWIRLRAALAHQRVLSREHLDAPPLSQQSQAFLAEINSADPVSNAAAAIAINRDAINTAWHARLDPE